MRRPAMFVAYAAAAAIVLLWIAAVAKGAESNSAVARVMIVRGCQHGRCSRCYGSGTLIYKDVSQGIVLTCAHLFRGEPGKITIAFSNGREHEGVVLGSDTAWDLALVKIAAPAATPVTIAADHPKPGDSLQSCGYGPDGRYWCNQGQARGYVRTAATTTYETLELTGHARDGDSGGPIFNQQGELVAVLWGTDGRVVGGTYCGRVRKFLETRFPRLGIFGHRQPQRPMVPVEPVKPDPSIAALVADFRQRFDGLAGQLEAAKTEQAGRVDKLVSQLEAVQKQQGGQSAKLEEALELLPGLTERMPAILPAVLTALGWTGPPSIAAIAGLWLLRSILRRRRARPPKKPRPEEGGSAAADRLFRHTGVIPRDDTEAAEFLRLSQLEGRNPLHDALIGRLTFDTLDGLAESNGPKADWARKLRQDLEDKFNQMAPPAIFGGRQN